jgi:Uma2 family endonuclease
MGTVGTPDDRYTAEQYFGLVDQGVLREDDRVELLDGVIVATSLSGPRHASTISMILRALFAAVGDRASVRSQSPLIAGRWSVPEPDAAIVMGADRDYVSAHPTNALLVVEASDSSLPQDRLTKSRIYAAAGIPEYWIVNLREGCLEVLRAPDPATRSYADRRIVHRGDVVELAALPDVAVAVEDLLPAA